MKVTSELFVHPNVITDLEEDIFYVGTHGNSKTIFFIKGEAGIWILNSTDNISGVEPDDTWVFDNLTEIRPLVAGESFTIKVD